MPRRHIQLSNANRVIELQPQLMKRVAFAAPTVPAALVTSATMSTDDVAQLIANAWQDFKQAAKFKVISATASPPFIDRAFGAVSVDEYHQIAQKYTGAQSKPIVTPKIQVF